jgi:hypothetical protein
MLRDIAQTARGNFFQRIFTPLFDMWTQAGVLKSSGASNRGCLRLIRRLPYGSDVAVQGLLTFASEKEKRETPGLSLPVPLFQRVPRMELGSLGACSVVSVHI